MPPKPQDDDDLFDLEEDFPVDEDEDLVEDDEDEILREMGL